MKFVQLLNETTIKQQYKNVDDIVKWVDTLQITKRKPQSISKVEHSAILNLLNKVNDYKHSKFPKEKTFYGIIVLNSVEFLRLDIKEYENVYTDQKKPTTIKNKFATYTKYDTSAYDEFLKNVNTIEKFLGTLNGYHKKILNGLKIKFVSADEIRAKATYRTSEDTLYINAKKMGKTEDGYGSLVYVVLHELGHRYLKFNPQNWDHNREEFVTTRYSGTDSFTGEEKFAELFALSNWPNKYKEYKEKIDTFKKLIK